MLIFVRTGDFSPNFHICDGGLAIYYSYSKHKHLCLKDDGESEQTL